MENRYTETHKTWDGLAREYEEKFMDFKLYDDTYKQFSNELSRVDANLLEVGCGPGNITRQLLTINPQLRILATDVSQNMLDLASENNPGIRTQVLDCRNLSIVDGIFDGIVCGFIMPYLSELDCAKLINNCSKLLAKGGLLYLSFVAGDSKNSGFVSNSVGERIYFYYHTIHDVKQELEKNALSIIEIVEKEYVRSETELEVHSIVLVQKV